MLVKSSLVVPCPLHQLRISATCTKLRQWHTFSWHLIQRLSISCICLSSPSCSKPALSPFPVRSATSLKVGKRLVLSDDMVDRFQSLWIFVSPLLSWIKSCTEGKSKSIRHIGKILVSKTSLEETAQTQITLNIIEDGEAWSQRKLASNSPISRW